jgi:hypothetical protein
MGAGIAGAASHFCFAATPLLAISFNNDHVLGDTSWLARWASPNATAFLLAIGVEWSIGVVKFPPNGVARIEPVL